MGVSRAAFLQKSFLLLPQPVLIFVVTPPHVLQDTPILRFRNQVATVRRPAKHADSRHGRRQGARPYPARIMAAGGVHSPLIVPLAAVGDSRFQYRVSRTPCIFLARLRAVMPYKGSFILERSTA